MIRDVPGEICDTCGEVYHDAEITQLLLDQAEQACRNGVDVEVRRYKKAA
ncbi:MAG: YgiT-type zinc finger protein [Candidatus Competibacteraceae bacterium]